MRGRGGIVLAAGLSIFAVGCATLAAYLSSILAVEWKDSELTAAIGGDLLAGVLALSAAAFILSGRSGIFAVVRSAALLIVGTCAVTAGLYFTLLANCRLSCSARVVARSKSPDGHSTAVWSEESCVAAARHCPSISRLKVPRNGEELEQMQDEVMSVVGDVHLELDWMSNDRLVISHWGSGRVRHRQNRVGTVRLEYRQVGSM